MDEDYGINLEHEYHNLGNDYYKISEFGKAIENYNKALELKPDLSETYFNRALAHLRMQEYPKAIDDLKGKQYGNFQTHTAKAAQ